MESATFCSECGERLKARRARLGSGRVSCAGCAPRLRMRRFLRAAGLALLLLAAFALGHYSTPPRTVYLLGTPIEPLAVAAQDEATAAGASLKRGAAEATGSGDETVSLCGATTKSGKPCQRKVKGGGYCYQHRGKYGAKNVNRKSQ